MLMLSDTATHSLRLVTLDVHAYVRLNHKFVHEQCVSRLGAQLGAQRAANTAATATRTRTETKTTIKTVVHILGATKGKTTQH